MATTFQKIVKQAVSDSDVYPDKIVIRANGTVEVKKSFFYRHGRSAEKLAADVSAVLTAAGIEHQSIGCENYADWPKTSYFVAVVREKGH